MPQTSYNVRRVSEDVPQTSFNLRRNSEDVVQRVGIQNTCRRCPIAVRWVSEDERHRRRGSVVTRESGLGVTCVCVILTVSLSAPSESDLGDWTGDCESLDETPLPSTRKLGGRSGADVILLATFPPAGVTLAEHLVNCRHLEMPRRVHEQVLEVTKTVTMMEIVNSAPDKHPRSCEVTITNIASDTGHPISLKISHLHTMQNVDHRDSGTQTPDIEVQEQTWDAIQRAPDGTSHIEQELATRVERFRPRRAASGTTFNLLTDNLIDLQFTQPVLSETHDQQRRSAAARVSSQGGPAVQKLYYRPFAEHDGSEHSVADPPEAVRPTPQNDRRSVVDEADLQSMTASVASSRDSLIIYVDPRPRGRASSAEGYFITIPCKAWKSRSHLRSYPPKGHFILQEPIQKAKAASTLPLLLLLNRRRNEEVYLRDAEEQQRQQGGLSHCFTLLLPQPRISNTGIGCATVAQPQPQGMIAIIILLMRAYGGIS
ncbi:unnamed protein product [Heligmosomoides polygyrus]|uniref:Cadherin domain-containing protein n=1 Tax=Heligmosomoides polygyrus TaxID=6339 RepID=A0A183F2G1_HELPZ|nr:unnamed protein product [Heligmosomoides polygyrus]